MKVTLNVRLVNNRYSQKFADEHYGGKESEDNMRFIWEDEFEVSGDVKEFKVLNNQSFRLAGEFPDGKTFDYHIPDVSILQCHLRDGSVSEFPVSGKLIQRTDKKTDKEGNLVFKVLLKGGKDFVNPMDGAYILKKDFPVDLIPYLPADEDDEDDDLDDELKN